jgi:hypothetical protein
LTTFLSSKTPRPRIGEEAAPRLRHALKLRLMSIREDQGRFFFEDHLEQTEDWLDTLLVDIEPPSAGQDLPQVWRRGTTPFRPRFATGILSRVIF